MRPRERKKSWADGVELAGAGAVGAAFSGIIPFLLQSGGLFPLLGVAIFVCGIPIGLLIFWRELKLDIKALDDPNDNPRTNRLIANRGERGSFDARRALLGALLVLMPVSGAYLYERWTIAAYIASAIFMISALLLVRRALKLIRSISI